MSLSLDNKLVRWLLMALACLPAAFFAYLGHFSRLAADDWAHILLGREHGPWRNVLYWRQTWNGAYADYFLHGLLAPLDWLAASVMPGLIIVIWAAALAWLFWQVLAWLGAGRHRLSLALSLASLTVGASVSAFYTPQSFYWLSASARYAFPLALFVGCLAFMLAAGRRAHSSRGLGIAGIVGGLICFAVGGFSEVYLIFQSACLALLLAALLVFLPGRMRMKALCLFGGGLLGSLASAWVQWTSPGRLIRSDYAQNYPRVQSLRDPGDLLDLALFDAHRLLIDPQVLAAMLLVFGAVLFLTLRMKRLSLPSGIGEGFAHIDGRLPYGAIALIQALLLPALWTHSSDDALFLGRFSLSFMAVVCINAGVIVACLLVIARYGQFQAMLRGSRWRLSGYALALLLLALPLLLAPHFRDIYILARNTLFMASLSLLALAWWEWSRDKLARKEMWLCLLPLLFTGAALLIAAAMIAVPRYFLGTFHAVGQLRRLAGAAFLLVSLGLVWGFALGYCGRRMSQAGRRRLRLASLLIVIAAWLSIIIGQLRILPDFRLYAQEWDERHALLIDIAETGQRHAVIPARAFNLYLFILTGDRLPGMDEPSDGLLKAYYGFDSITLVDDG